MLIAKPFQDPDGVFHCYYQCMSCCQRVWSMITDVLGVPASTEWSHDIGWGHAWSKDGIEWETTSEPVLMPGEAGSYDHMGVFTVCGTVCQSLIFCRAVCTQAHKTLISIYSSIRL